MIRGSDPASAGERAARLAAEAHVAGYRRLVLLAGSRSWTRRCGEAMLRGAADPASALWAGHAAPDGIPSCPPDGLVRYLGSETSCLIVDAHDGLDPDGLGAGFGTVRAGGLVLLLVPPLADWPHHPDPQAARLTVDGWAPEAVAGRFIRRLRRILTEDSYTVVVEEGGTPAEAKALPHGPVPAGAGDRRCMTADQAAAVAAVVRTATGHRRRPSVLTADRGRGKSAALGIAAAEVLAERGGDIVVTGPRRSAVDAVLRHAAGSLGVAVHRGRVAAPGGGSLRFLLPEELQACDSPPALVLVDEAAAVPTAILADLLRRHSRIVFATTVHGYEGSGRGFSLRFRGVLDAETPRWQEIRLETPIRWRPGDPVEAVLFRALLLDADLPAAGSGGREGALRLERLDRESLLEDEPLLRDLFGLLVHAHYRTRPMDLRNLLDGPNLFLDLLRQDDRVAGVALSADEGGFTGDVAQAIWSGRRRPHGHLLPQSLASHVGVPDGAAARALRVMRIAVHPELQRRGLGTRLLGELAERARGAGYDLIGASFGATPGLIAFWEHAGFRPVRLGIRRDAASGTHSALMVQGRSEGGDSLVERARERMARDYPVQLADPLARLEPELALMLLRGLRVPEPSETDWLDAVGFAHGHRAYEVSMAGLYHVALWALADPACAAELGARACRGLMARVLQHRPWADAAAGAGEAGRPGLVKLLRGAVRGLVTARAPADVRRLAAQIAGEADYTSSS